MVILQKQNPENLADTLLLAMKKSKLESQPGGKQAL
jgi:hypothetical protein